MVAGLISGLAGGFLPSELRTGDVLEISCLHLLLHFSGKAVPGRGCPLPGTGPGRAGRCPTGPTLGHGSQLLRAFAGLPDRTPRGVLPRPLASLDPALRARRPASGVRTLRHRGSLRATDRRRRWRGRCPPPAADRAEAGRADAGRRDGDRAGDEPAGRGDGVAVLRGVSRPLANRRSLPDADGPLAL